MRPIPVDVILSLVCLCLLVTTVGCAKTAERIEMPFAVGTRVGPRNIVLDGGPIPTEGGKPVGVPSAL